MKTRAAVAFEAGKPLEICEVDLDGPRAGGPFQGRTGGGIIEAENGVGLARGFRDSRTGEVEHRPDQIPGPRPVGGEPDFRPRTGRSAQAPAFDDKIEGKPGQDFADQSRSETQARTGLLDRDHASLELEIPPPKRAVHSYGPSGSHATHSSAVANTRKSRSFTDGAEIA